MNEKKTHQQKVNEQLDAFRPGSDDLQLPEFAELAAELGSSPRVRDLLDTAQSLDRALTRAYQDVEIPAGLQRRLLVGIETADNISGMVQTDDDLPHASDTRPTPPPKRFAWWPDVYRSKWSTLTGAVVVAVVLGLLAVLVWARPAVRNSDLKQLASEVWHSIDSPDGGWHPVDSDTALKLESDATWLRLELNQGRTVTTSVDRQAAVFRAGPKVKAYLFVFRTPVADELPTRPPVPPQGYLTSSQGGRVLVGFWRNQNCDTLYALVVHGDERDYQMHIQQGTMALAFK